MQQAHIHLIKYAIATGHKLAVYDGGEWAIKRSTDINAILDVVDSVEQSTIEIRDTDNKIVGKAVVLLDYQQQPDETIINHTLTPFMEAWDNDYVATAY